jgi:hypothetical protein
MTFILIISKNIVGLLRSNEKPEITWSYLKNLFHYITLLSLTNFVLIFVLFDQIKSKYAQIVFQIRIFFAGLKQWGGVLTSKILASTATKY